MPRPFVDNIEEFEVYKLAYALSMAIHKQTLHFPKIEQYDLGSQMRRASKSICANLAEGYAKQSISRPEFKRFISMAIGSAGEMQVWLKYCLDLAYIEKTIFEEWRKNYQAILKCFINLGMSFKSNLTNYQSYQITYEPPNNLS